jgi:starvation-inducible DNA-binding protein
MSILEFQIQSFKAENGGLLIEGISANSSIDSQGEKIIITPEALDEAIPIFLQNQPSECFVKSNNVDGSQNTTRIECPNNGYMRYHHGGIDKNFNQVGKASIGKVLEMTYNVLEDGNIEIPVRCFVTNDLVIKLINNGYARNFSLNWFWLVRTQDNTTGTFIDSKVALHELSVTPDPVNKQAKFDIVTTGNQFNVGERVLADQIPMTVKAVMSYSDNIYYELQPEIGSYKNDLVLPEQSLKAFVTEFDDNNLDQIIKKVLLEKIKTENYNIPTQRVTNFNYELSGQLTFGQNSNYKTSIIMHSNGKAEITKPISGATKVLPESLKAEIQNDLVIKMNEVIGTAYDLSINTHALHWNITGQDFQQYHEYLGDLYNQLFTDLDEYAEHLRALEYFTQYSSTDILKYSKLDVQNFDPQTDSITSALSLEYQNFKTLRDLVNQTQVIAGDNAKPELQNFLQGKVDEYNKVIWQLGASIENPETKIEPETPTSQGITLKDIKISF